MDARKIKGIFSLIAGLVVTIIFTNIYNVIADKYSLQFGRLISTIILMLLCLPVIYGASIFYQEFTKKK